MKKTSSDNTDNNDIALTLNEGLSTFQCCFKVDRMLCAMNMSRTFRV